MTRVNQYLSRNITIDITANIATIYCYPASRCIHENFVSFHRLCRMLNTERAEDAWTVATERKGGGREMGNETYAPSGVEVRARYTVYAEIFIDLGCGNYGPQNEAVLVCIPGHAGNLSVRMNAAVPALRPSFDLVPASTGSLKKEPRKVCTLSSSSVCLWKTGEFSNDERILRCLVHLTGSLVRVERLAEWEMMK